MNHFLVKLLLLSLKKLSDFSHGCLIGLKRIAKGFKKARTGKAGFLLSKTIASILIT
jgi:hypothetical protein